MSFKIIKAGILDTVQDKGCFGYQHLGINPSGAMDRFSAQLANALLGKNLSSPVLEMHYPAATILFTTATVICVCGADFSPVINGTAIPLHQPVALSENSILEFKKWKTGAWCYLSFLPELKIEKWLNSYSTHLKAAAGGFKGRALQTDDEIFFDRVYPTAQLLKGKKVAPLPWKVQVDIWAKKEIHCLIGAEWNWLTEDAKKHFQSHSFLLAHKADRMGYRLTGKPLQLKKQKQMLSSAVTFGTLQLLPNGQLIALMADHQTTGGYPRVAQVLSAHLPALAQKRVNEALTFTLVNLEEAEQQAREQQTYLHQLHTACTFHIEKWFS